MKLYESITSPDLHQIKIFNFTLYKNKLSGIEYEKSFFSGIYKIKRTLNSKRYYILCVRILKIKINTSNISPNSMPYNYHSAFIVEYFCELQQKKYKNNPLDIKKLLASSKAAMLSCSENYMEKSHGWVKYIFGGKVWSIDSLPYDNKGADLFVLLGGIGQTPAQINLIVEAMQINRPVLILESAFLRSINTFCENNFDEKFRYDIGFVIDYLTAYYDATRPSFLELMLNDTSLKITDAQIKRSRSCINRIVNTHLTKYNCQPIFKPEIGRKNVKKVLLIDQSFGDNSVKKGYASVDTFKIMLETAIMDNPDSDIIIKTHPDTQTGNRTGYYSDLQDHDNIYIYTEPINPISLIQYVDKVYVCTSQFGFEAAMCGKDVHVFGIPFYSGWGITKDYQICQRRTNKRSIEEIFYITYILYSFYINPKRGCICEIEEAMDFLLDLRQEFFEANNIRSD